jgi:hypothetical protein
MTTLIEAARQALPGLDWKPDGDDCGVFYAKCAIGTLYIVEPMDEGEEFGASMGCDDETVLFPRTTDAAQWLRAQVTARRDALDAALGEPQHLGTSARDWCGMWDIARARADAAEAKLKALVASWPIHYHRQGCTIPCNCGADAANAARAEARRLVEVKDA